MTSRSWISNPSPTWLEFAKAEALRLGFVITDEVADYILWECTAFPFANPDYIRQQIVEELGTPGWRSDKVKTTGPTAWDKLDSEEP